ncbi:DEAD/DEAH box helicase [Bacillus alkalicellulosilyticus]|uniref:DEAD/DEAH box helicase n=1 Tax=Alkalihalobacterium alkalicellulosilyticum TaxID=1912214 RepID=UPI0009973D34|nr:DEAD/DEAH box helicase [Bacillus alkalicellulosilyticus]
MKQDGFKSFSLNDGILRALEQLKYDRPTEVQEKVIPIVLTKKDVVVKSKTGSGKTAAFGIPLCQLCEWDENRPQALVLTPTRELAVQVKEDILNIGRFKRMKAIAIFGKQSFERQKIELKQKNHIVVGTPGRILDHIQKGTLVFDKIKYLVIDEADDMLNMGFIDQVEAIINELPRERVTMLFSATLPEDIEKLSKKYMSNHEAIEIQTSKTTVGKIEHVLLEVNEANKFNLLLDVTIVENPDSCIIFCGTQEEVDNLYRKLKKANYPCEKIHGGMKQEDRFSVMNDFRKGQFRYLIATNVAARGIDIADISHVINYDFPYEKESYVHRTGRTGRAGKNGKAITFLTPSDEKYLKETEQLLGYTIPRGTPPPHDEVIRAKDAFEKKRIKRPPLKNDKKDQVNEGIMKLYFNGGKKKKLRAVDFVGTLSKLPGVTADDIGIITIQENSTFVDILNGKGIHVLEKMKTTTIKGKQLKVYQAKE